MYVNPLPSAYVHQRSMQATPGVAATPREGPPVTAPNAAPILPPAAPTEATVTDDGTEVNNTGDMVKRKKRSLEQDEAHNHDNNQHAGDALTRMEALSQRTEDALIRMETLSERTEDVLTRLENLLLSLDRRLEE
jgi:hypothetical protein